MLNRLSPFFFLGALAIAFATLVSAQTTLQRPKTLDPRIFSGAKAIPAKPPSSMMHMHLPSPMPAEPDWRGKHEPLTLHVADSSLPGRGTAISVSQADGSGFYYLGEEGVVQVYSPYYALKRVDRIADVATFVFGNDTVECKVTASSKGSLFKLTLACQRNDPDIPSNSQFEQRPFFVLVARKDPETGVVRRGEAMVTLNGYVTEKP